MCWTSGTTDERNGRASESPSADNIAIVFFNGTKRSLFFAADQICQIMCQNHGFEVCIHVPMVLGVIYNVQQTLFTPEPTQ